MHLNYFTIAIKAQQQLPQSAHCKTIIAQKIHIYSTKMVDL